MLPLLLFGCLLPVAGSTPGDSADSADSAGENGDTGSPDSGDSASTDSGDSGNTDDTAPALQGLSGQRGTATVGATYAGTDERYFVADRGSGDDVCRLAYTVNSTGTRADCVGDVDACDWAFDVVYGAAEIVAESGDGCAGVGIDAAAIEGTTAGYGYVADYYGHPSVLMIADGGVWNPATLATFDRGALEYDWEYGLVEY